MSLYSLSLVLFLSLFLVGCTSESSIEEYPNIVIVYTDDQGYQDVGVFGAEGYETPNLDRMAGEGIRLTSFYVSSPVCSASRASLLTGSYHVRVGIHGALFPHHNHGLHEREVTLGDLVKQKGYATTAIGKWHLGHHPEFLPPNHGFDSYFGIPYSNDMSPEPKHNPRENATQFPPLPLVRDLEVVEYEPDQSLLTKRYTEEALDFIENNADRPFLLYLAHSMPHAPIFASEAFAGSSGQGVYGDVIQEIDWSVGQILDKINALGLDDQTLVIFTSDNGPWKVFGNHGGETGPLRGNKGTVWEGGVRVPFIARWPGKIPAGSASDEPVMTIDILPTVAELIHAELPGHPIDGKTIWPILSGQPGSKSPHEALFFYYNRELQAMRSGDWKLHFPHTYRVVDEVGADGMPGSYVHPMTGLELYNLEADIGESEIRTEEEPEVLGRLSGFAEEIRKELGDRLTEQEGGAVRPAATLDTE